MNKQDKILIKTTKPNSETSNSNQRDSEFLSKDLSINKAALISYLRS